MVITNKQGHRVFSNNQLHHSKLQAKRKRQRQARKLQRKIKKGRR